MDIVSRKRRMEGHNVLYPIGWDAFGLPTENYAIKTGEQPSVITKKNTDTFRKQAKSLGMSFDWSREVNTTDPNYYKWTQWLFLQFFKKGLAYKAKSEINWCPKDKTGLANEEVIDGKCERCGTPTIKKEKEQWMLGITKYAERLDKDLDLVDYPERVKSSQRNWIGKSEGSEIEFSIKENILNKKKKILIGTRNEAKIRMMKECLPSFSDIEFVSLNDIPAVDDSSLVEGMDYVINAKMKAEFYFKKTGLPTISTDNVFWLEKWKKDNGIMLHMRKEANPKSDRATDEEVIKFLKSLVRKIGGKSKAHFIYAVAFASLNGTESFVSKQKDYILQGKQSNNFWKGYPTESLLIDSKTKEYKGDQENNVRYDILINDLKEHSKKWFEDISSVTIKVFTTRADTLFGATYVVLAPEHQLVQNLKSQITNWNEVLKYISDVNKKSDLERAENKEKIGVELKGVKAINPANGEEIPIYIADYVLAGYGTGAVMAVPAHDERDFEFAKKYDLHIREVIEPLVTREIGNDAFKKNEPINERNAVVAVIKHWSEDKYLGVHWKKTDWKGFVIGGIENGEDKIVAGLREITEETGYKNVEFVKSLGGNINARFYQQVKKHNRLAHFEPVLFKLKNGETIETTEEEKVLHEFKWLLPKELEIFITHSDMRLIWERVKGNYCYTDDDIFSMGCRNNGILINSEKFNGLEIEVARKKITEFVGGKIVTKFKLRDWVFSRQRYWGEPIPVVNCKKCGLIPVKEKDLPIKLPAVKSYKPTDNGESPLAGITKWVNTKCPKCGGKAKRETDTMPNWAGSSWYYLRYTDPKNKKEFASKKNLKYWIPVDWYNGGMEHTTLHLLYSRFWHKFFYDLKLVPTVEPYLKRTSHGMILGEGGVKMSKSLGNVVNPDEIVKTYGADTLRVYEMFIGPFEDTAVWNTESIIGSRRFIEKVWRLREKVLKQKNSSGLTLPGVPGGTHTVPNFSISKLLHKTIKKVGEDIEAMRFNTAISAMMILATEIEKAEFIEKEDYKKFLKILAPFAPHITEDIWQSLGEKKSINISIWPKYDENLIKDDEIKIAVQVNGKTRAEIIIFRGMKEEEVKEFALKEKNVISWTENKEIKRIIYVPGRVINIVV